MNSYQMKLTENRSELYIQGTNVQVDTRQLQSAIRRLDMKLFTCLAIVSVAFYMQLMNG